MAVTLFNLLRVAQLNQQQLETRELCTQAGNLHIQTLEDATCSHPLDEERIRNAIAGQEDPGGGRGKGFPEGRAAAPEM